METVIDGVVSVAQNIVWVSGKDYIDNQDALGVGNLPLGGTTISHGGCGVIASYNALVALGDLKPLISVLEYYNENPFRTVLYGLGGISPTTVASYFRDNNYRVYMTDDLDGINIGSASADACILWYCWPNDSISLLNPAPFYAHYVAYNRLGPREYVAYNEGGNSRFSWPSDFAYKDDRYYAIGIFIYK